VGKRVAQQKPGESRFIELKRIAPRALTIFGLLLLLIGLIAVPADLKTYNRDNELRATGATATATVESVDRVHHSGRRSSWNEYIPLLSASIDGTEHVFRMSDYSSKSFGTFAPGQKLTLMYEQGNPYHLPGIKSDGARSDLTGNLVRNSIVGSIGALMVLIGAPILIVRFARRRRAKQASRADLA